MLWFHWVKNINILHGPWVHDQCFCSSQIIHAMYCTLTIPNPNIMFFSLGLFTPSSWDVKAVFTPKYVAKGQSVAILAQAFHRLKLLLVQKKGKAPGLSDRDNPGAEFPSRPVFKRFMLLLREDYRYLLAIWERLDNFKKPWKIPPTPANQYFQWED